MKRILLLGLFLSAHLHGAEMIRLKTFREIISSLMVATNLELRDPLILKIYDERRMTLPQTGKFDEFNPVGASTLFGLSSYFCQKMVLEDVKKESSERWAHMDVDFSLPANDALSPMVQHSILSLYAELFWQRSLDQDEQEYMSGLMGSFITMLGTLPDSTQEVLTSTCSVMGSSLGTLIVMGK